MIKVETHCAEISSCNQALNEPDTHTNPQETAKLLQTRLYHEESWEGLCKAAISYTLNVASSEFKAFSMRISDIKNQLGLPKQDRNRDEKSINKNIEELNKTINQGLKDLNLKPSKKHPATRQILKARELQCQLGEDIQKIKSENIDLIDEKRKLLENSRYSMKHAAYIIEKVKEELKDIRERHGFMSTLEHLNTNPTTTKDTSTGDQLIQGGIESMKKYWRSESEKHLNITEKYIH